MLKTLWQRCLRSFLPARSRTAGRPSRQLRFYLDVLESRLAPSTNPWTSAGTMSTGRAVQTATLLGDGRVLVAGGFSGNDLSSVDIYDPVNNSWSAPVASSLATARDDFTATLLNNGKVLVLGGANAGAAVNTAELYDPISKAWSAAQPLPLGYGRIGFTATLLNNGNVLIVGGTNSGAFADTAFLYNPASDTWSPAGQLDPVGDPNQFNARAYHTATLLANGKVLVTGGRNERLYLKTAELYDPATNSWSSAGSMAVPRESHTATLLPSGKVLVAGGFNDGTGDLNSAELYDPATNTWSGAGSLITPRDDHTATLLGDGKVLVAGGTVGSTKLVPGLSLASAELYDPGANTWSAVTPMSSARDSQTATLLRNGKVLITGGSSNGLSLASAELLDPYAQSIISITPARIAVGGSAQVQLVVRDAAGKPEPGSSVVFGLGAGSSGGTFGQVANQGNGIYFATFGGSTAGTPRTITATIGGTAFTAMLPTITVVGPLSLSNSTITVAPPRVAIGGATTVKLTARDAFDNQELSGGSNVVFALGGGGSGTGNFGPVNDHGDATYTATFTGITAGTPRTVTATIDGNAVTSTPPTVAVVGPLSVAQSTVSALTTTTLDVGSTARVTITARDAFGNQQPAGGLNVVLGEDPPAADSGSATFQVVDNLDGSYSGILTATTQGTNNITVTISGQPLTNGLPQSFTVRPGPGVPDAQTQVPTITTDQPIFTWQPDLNATSYQLSLFDELSPTDQTPLSFFAANNLTEPVVTGRNFALTSQGALSGQAVGVGAPDAVSSLALTPGHLYKWWARVVGTTRIFPFLFYVAPLAAPTAPEYVGRPNGGDAKWVPFGAFSFAAEPGTKAPLALDTSVHTPPGSYTVTLTDVNSRKTTTIPDVIGTSLDLAGHVTAGHTYTATVTAVSTNRQATALGKTSAPFTIPAPDAPLPSLSQSTVTVAPASVKVGGTVTVTLTARDAAGNQLTTGGLTVDFGLGSDAGNGQGSGTLTNLVDHGNGTYTATFTATNVGTTTVVGTFVTAASGPQALTSAAPNLSVTASTLSDLRKQYGFIFSGNYYQNSSGKNEKWFQDRKNDWYIITPDGALSKWNGGSSFTALGVTVDAQVWSNPLMLLAADLTQFLSNADQRHFIDLMVRFEFTYFPSYNGVTYKWLQDGNEQWYALRNDGLLFVWDNAMNDLDPNPVTSLNAVVWDDPNLLIQVDVTQALTDADFNQLQRLQKQYGFYTTGSYFESTAGLGYKWILDRGGKNWYVLEPNGALLQWQGGTSFTPVPEAPTALNPVVFANPNLLLQAPATLAPGTLDTLASLSTTNGFHFAGDYALNWLQLNAHDTRNFNEKWFQDNHGQWYFITDTGVIYKPDTVTPLAQVDVQVYDDPSLLFEAKLSATARDLLRTVEEHYGFFFFTSFYADANSKWFMSKESIWYVIHPTGLIQQWDGGTSFFDVVTVDAQVFNDPYLLFDV